MSSEDESVNSVHNAFRRNHRNDPYKLESGENSSLVLVAEPLNEFNYVTWSKAVIKAMKSKGKLRFLTGEIRAPDQDDEMYEQWEKVNSTIISWILNSISVKLARGFMFCDDVYTLWNEIKEGFGESNAPLLHKIMRDISELKQGSESVSVYYNQLKSLWDEFRVLRPRKRCTVGCVNYDCLQAEEEEDKLSQFLMGLNEEYSQITQQILMMDPSPTVNKACSMVSRVEKQKSVHDGYNDGHNNSAMAVRVYREYRGSQYQRRDPADELNSQRMRNMNVVRTDLKCENCGRPGHMKENCYEIVGFPDGWSSNRSFRTQQQSRYQAGSSAPSQQQSRYQAGSSAPSAKPSPTVYQIPQQRSSHPPPMFQKPQYSQYPPQRYAAHAVAEEEECPLSESDSKLQALVSKMVEAQLEKREKGKEPMQNHGAPVNYEYYHDFSGPQD